MSKLVKESLTKKCLRERKCCLVWEEPLRDKVDDFLGSFMIPACFWKPTFSEKECDKRLGIGMGFAVGEDKATVLMLGNLIVRYVG